MYFLITDAKEFVLVGVRFSCGTSFTLYVLIPKFGTTLTKNSLKVLASLSFDVLTADSSMKEIRYKRYLIGENNIGQSFRHLKKFSSLLSDEKFCPFLVFCILH